MAYLYRHIRLDKNVPFYIGIGSDNNGLYTRANSRHSRSKYWRNISQKGYEVEILMDGLTWEQACEKEKEFIALYGRLDLGGLLVNMTDGGDGALGFKHTDAAKIKISESSKGRRMPMELKIRLAEINKKRIRSEETINKWKLSRLGWKPTEKNRLNMSIGQKGKKLSVAHRESISKAKKGLKPSSETIIKKSISARGNKSALGHKHSEDAKKKMSDAAKGRNISLDTRLKISETLKKIKSSSTYKGFKGFIVAYKNGEEVGRYMTFREASDCLGVSKSSVGMCLIGRLKTSKGFKFERILPK